VHEGFAHLEHAVFIDTNANGKKQHIDNLTYPNAFMSKMEGKFMSQKEDAPSLISPEDVLKVEYFTKAYFCIQMHMPKE
jgi:hypothetical protein